MTQAAPLVSVRAPDGTVGTVAASELQQALDAGATVLDAPDARAAEYERLRSERAGTTLGTAERAVDLASLVPQAIAGQVTGMGGLVGLLAPGAMRSTLGKLSGTAEGAAYSQAREDAYTLGLGKLARKAAIGAVEGDDAAQRYVQETRLAQEIAPTAATLGAVEGGVESAVAASGLAATGGLAKYLAGPALIPELGGAAASAALDRAGIEVGKRALTSAVGLGVRGAVEGGITGASQELTEQVFGDPEIVGERVFLAAGKGALMGLGTGAALGAAAPAIQRVSDRIAAGRHTRLADKAADLTNGAKGKIPEAEAVDAPPPAIVQKYIDNFEDADDLRAVWRDRHRVLAKHDDTIETSSRRITQDLEAAVQAERAIDMQSFGDAKAGQMAKLVEGDRIKQAVAAGERVNGVRELIRQLKEDPTFGGVSKKRLDDLDKVAAKVEGRIAKAETGSDVFVALDDLKRAVGKNSTANSPYGMPDAVKYMQTEYEALRKSLEDTTVWGKAGDAQREINLATAQRLETRGKFEADFLREMGKRDFVPFYGADSAKVDTFVRSLTQAKNDTKALLLRQYVENERKFLDAVEKHYAFGDADKGRIAQLRKSFDTIDKTLADTTKSVEVSNLAKRMQAEEQAAGVGGVLGIVTDTFTRPMKTMARLHALQEMHRKISVKVLGETRKRADDMVDAAAKGAAGTKRSSAYRSAPPPKAPVRERYEAAADHVRGMQADTAGVSQRAEYVARVEGAPNVSQAYARAIARTAGALAAKLPMAGPNARHKPRPTQAEMREFLAAYDAAMNPEGALRQISSGSLDPAVTRMLEASAPQTFAELRGKVTEGVYQRIERGDPPGPTEAIKLKLAFGIVVDPTHTPEALVAQQAAADLDTSASGPQQGPQQGRPKPKGRINLDHLARVAGPDRLER